MTCFFLLCLPQLMENAAYTFEILLSAALKGNPVNPASDIEKVKHRVLKVGGLSQCQTQSYMEHITLIR